MLPRDSASHQASTAPTSRHGITLTELLVVLAIIAILAGLTLVGIQASRSATRRISCASNLRQIGLALSSYESSWGVFPPGQSRHGSMQVAILPYVGQRPLYDRIAKHKDQFGATSQLPFPLPSISVYNCPADFRNSKAACTNYAGCTGVSWTHPSSTEMDGMFRLLEQLYHEKAGPVSPSEVRDGLSSTIAMSEILVSRNSDETDRLRVNWITRSVFADLDPLVEACRSLPQNPRAAGWHGAPERGVPWSSGDMGATLYNHAMTPNQPSCYNGGDVLSMVSTASSYHYGGVNVLYGDGHCSFIVDSVDVKLWRELATRAGSTSN